MVELVDRNSNHKMMAMIIGGLQYQDSSYLIYSIRRDQEMANIFVSKMLKGSLGYVIENDFDNGEREVLDGIIKRLLNKDSKEELEDDGFRFIKNVDLDSNLFFDIDKCYVSTVNRSLIKDCLIYYGLVSERMFNQPIVEVKDDKRLFNEGFASSIVLIIFGAVVLIFSCVVILGVIFG
ncbi:MAG: hypothetical protein IJ509_03190 [Bacilli bacterium]|nr:hypothetical protein [Bacilli bacterium]